MDSESLNFIFLIIIIVVIYFIYNHHSNTNTTNNNSSIHSRKKYNSKSKSKPKSKSRSKSKSKSRHKVNNKKTYEIEFENDDEYNNIFANDGTNNLNRELLTSQYHVDYYDTITGINYITSQKELFNMGFLPAKDVKPDDNVVNDLTELFIGRLNHEIDSTVTEYIEPNSGWHDMGKRRRIKNGFEEQQEELGLPSTIYNEGAKKEKVELIHIQKASQTNTDDQARIEITMVLQKPHVKDQIVLKVLFFMEREDMKGSTDNRNDFFKQDLNRRKDNVTDQEIIIEQVFIVGFLTNDGEPKTSMDKFYNYEDIKNVDGTLDQSKIIKAMIQKQRERSKEHSSFLCTLADEDKQIHDVPSLDSYDSYNLTRTIVDDLKQFPHQSFGDITI